MRALPVMLVVAALGIPLIPANSLAEDLSDLAAREKERRKGKETKVLTDEDLKKKDKPGDENLNKPNDGPKQPDEGDVKLVFNFPLDGDTVYGKVPLNAQFYNAETVSSNFYVNGQLLGKGTAVRNWINASWDTAALPAGRYTIKVEALSFNGNKGSSQINVTLSKTVSVDPVVAACKKSTAKPVAGIFGLQNPLGEDQRSTQEMKDLGVKWARHTFTWQTIELVPGNYDWWYPDLVVTWAHDAGIQILAIPNVAPTWVEKLDWPQRYQAHQVFMKAMVDRYKPGGALSQKEGWKDGYGISYWELLNEPNLDDMGWRWAPNPARYTLWLAYGEAGVRAADPDAFVLFGGLSNVGFAPAGFMEYAEVLGAKNCFDIVSVHPYGYMDRFNEFTSRIQTLLTAYGDDPQKPIWFTEYGTLSNRNRDTELQKMFEQRNAAQAWFWLGLRDTAEENWGFLTTDWERKEPACKTLKALLSKQ